MREDDRSRNPITPRLGLRLRAEAVVAERPGVVPHEPAQVAALLHELDVHRVELEMQNDELRAAQAKLEQSRDRYQELYDSAPFGYMTTDRAGTILEVNRTASAMLDASKFALVGKNLASFLSVEDADSLHRHRYRVVDGGDRHAIEITITLPGRTPFPARLWSVASTEPEGQVRSVLINLSEVAAANARVEASEEQLRQITEHIADVFYMYEMAGTLSYVSSAFERIWGRPVIEAYANPRIWLEAVHPDDRPRVERAFHDALGGAPFDAEFRIRRPDGEERWVRDRAFPVRGDAGAVVRIIGVAQDITAERVLEEQLRQAQKMEAVGTLASGIAHDFNNVLQVVTGLADLALNETGSFAEARSLVQRIHSVAMRAGALASQLMAFSRKKVVAPRPVAIDTVIGGASSLIERLLGEHIRLTVELGAPNAFVLSDPVQVEQIFMNLAANARDAMPDGGTVSIRTSPVELDAASAARFGLPAASYVEIVFADTGRGMDAATRQRAFEPFYTTKGIGRGTGLGLTTVFSVTKRLGGHIDIDSEVGAGTGFSLLLPQCERGEAAQRPEPEAVATAEGVALLVDDEPLVRLTVRNYLEQMGLEVLEAANADEAEEAWNVHDGTIDLLVTDVMMPGGMGPALAGRLRARSSSLRVLYISAQPDAMIGVLGMDDPCVAVLHKPFDAQQLAIAVGRLALPLPG